MQTLELVDRYAKSVFELAENEGAQEALQSELSSLVGILRAKPQLLGLFQNPLLSRDEKHALIEGISPEKSSLVERFLMLLVEKSRVNLLPDITEHLQELIDEEKGIEEAKVITARPLDSSLRPLIEKTLARLTGKKISIQTETDTNLLGGIQIHIKNRLIDATIRRKLDDLGAQLKQVKVS